MQAQHPSGSVTEAITNTFKVDDDVTYVIARSTGHAPSVAQQEVV
ncbi:hypothetical protein [Pseudomonas agarici]|nr:hypothetical protein [Pseudomonas agarici]